MERSEEQRVLAGFAELLSYPNEQTLAAAEQVGVAASFRAASGAVLEELYTSTFDLQPSCAPYVGHHLLGEDTGRRGPFLAKLTEIYLGDGHRPREELADHVAEVLRFLAVARPSAARDDLVRDGLLPALRKMIEQLEDQANPYRTVLVALEELLSGFELGAHTAIQPATAAAKRSAAP